MKKLSLTGLLCFLLINSSHSETLEFPAYYPTPFGSYNRIRLYPRADLPAPCDIGTLYVNTSAVMKFCRDDGTGVGTWDNSSGPWSQVNNDLFLSNYTNPNLNVGIGSTAPDAALVLANSVPGGTLDALHMQNTAAQSGARIIFEESNQGNNFWIKYHSHVSGGRNWLEFWGITGASPIMTLQRDYWPPSGEFAGVGIGTPANYNVSSKLEVRNNGFWSEDILNLYDDTTEVLTVIDGGNVGIGVPNPSAQLEVNGNTIITGTIRGASWGFGGMYQTGEYGCEDPNPMTGDCSCPPGFNDVAFEGLPENPLDVTKVDTDHYCWK